MTYKLKLKLKHNNATLEINGDAPPADIERHMSDSQSIIVDSVS